MLMFIRLFGCLCVLMLGMMISHAEQAGPDDVTITDRTNHTYCMSGDRFLPARPPYYVVLICTDFQNPILQNKCHNLAQYSYCTMQDCEQEAQRFGATPHSLDGSQAMSKHVCASVDEYDQWTIITSSAKEQERPAPVPTCNPISLELNAVFTLATTKCPKDFMDTSIGRRVAELTIACYATMSEAETTKHVKSGQYGFLNSAKVNGIKRECEIVDNLQHSIGADLRWTK